MTLRALQAAGTDAVVEPDWMGAVLASLAQDDLAPATLRGYRYDLRHFLAWHRTVQDVDFAIGDLADFELIAYRQHMVAAGHQVNDDDLARVSPLMHAHVIPNGSYFQSPRQRALAP